MSLRVLHTVVDQLCDVVDRLGSSFPPPAIVPMGDGFVDRHDPRVRSNGLACYLKAVKICSTLNGALVLLQSGHVQEAFALGRVTQDQVEDIHFLVRPRGDDGGLSERQKTALDEFFQEEFTDSKDPVGTSQERDRVGRDKIRAAIHSAPAMDDPSTAQKIGKALYRVFSGYLHGAYVHIMELHSDRPGHYHMRGTPGTRLTEAIDYIPNFVFQAILAVEELVDRSSRDDLLPAIQGLKARVAASFDVLPESPHGRIHA
jgi:hypothetical protein